MLFGVVFLNKLIEFISSTNPAHKGDLSVAHLEESFLRGTCGTFAPVVIESF